MNSILLSTSDLLLVQALANNEARRIHQIFGDQIAKYPISQAAIDNLVSLARRIQDALPPVFNTRADKQPATTKL